MNSSAKRTTALISISLMLLGPAVAGQQAADQHPYDIPALTNITIDGKPADWGERGFRLDLLLQPDGKLRPVKSHDARARLGWSEKGLLILVSATDDHWMESEAEDQLWANDGVEVFLMQKPGAPDIAQWVVAPGMDARYPDLRCHFHDSRKTKGVMGLPAKAVVARTKAGRGYRMEMLLPWSSVAIEPAEGARFGFQVWVNDKEEGERDAYHAAWFPGLGTCFNSKNAHLCRLAKAPSPPESMRTKLDYDLDQLAMRVSVLARAENAGKEVELIDGAKTIGKAKFGVLPSGHASGEILVPLPPVGESCAAATAKVAGREIGEVDLGRLPRADLSRSVMVKFAGRGRTEWQIKLAPSDVKVGRVAAFAGTWRNAGSADVVGGGKALTIRGTTHWGEGLAVIEMSAALQGKLLVEANGHKQEVDLAKLASEAAEIKPGRDAGWAERDVLTVSAVTGEVAMALGMATSRTGGGERPSRCISARPGSLPARDGVQTRSSRRPAPTRPTARLSRSGVGRGTTPSSSTSAWSRTTRARSRPRTRDGALPPALDAGRATGAATAIRGSRTGARPSSSTVNCTRARPTRAANAMLCDASQRFRAIAWASGKRV